MAVDMFIKIETVEGESRDKSHPKEIDILAWSWGVSNSGTAHMGGGAGAGKANVQDLSFTKYIDKASAKLQLACCNGTHFTTAKLVVRKAGTTPVEYVVIELSDVLITSVSIGGSGGEDRLTENVSLNFAKIKFVYTPQDQTGKAESTKPEYVWNIAENADA